MCPCDLGVVAASFVIEKEEQTVFSAAEHRPVVLTEIKERQRPAQASAELVTLKCRTLDSVFIIKESIGGKILASVILTQRAMELV